VEGYDQLDEKYHSILAAAGYNAEAGDDDNKQALKENIFYTGDEKAGTWTIKLDTAVLDVEAIEFLVAVRDDQGAQWGNNNYVSYPNDVKAFLYNVTLPEPAITMTAGEPTIEDGKVTLAVTTKNTGADYENARYGIKVNAAGVEGDTISVSYGDEGLTFNLTRVEGSDDFIGYFGPADGFTITKGWDVTTTFTVDFGTAASDRTVKVDAWVNQGAEPAEEDAVAKMEQLEITIPAAEPEEYHTYKFKIEDKADEYIVSDGLVDPTDADFAGMTPVKLSIVVDSEKDKAYGGNVRVAPVNADGLQLWAKDTAGKWHDINQVGWGPSEGFPIDTTLVTDVYVIATAAFDGTVTLELVDVTGDYGAVDNIIISQEVAVKAVVDAIAQALAAVNAYLTPESYNYSGAPEALEEHLATLGLDVGTESDYAALDKTATGGKNRKTAVFYDLNNNKPAEGYDLSTLTTYFNDMVATRLVTEESMDLVNNAENTEALNGISFVTMLLDRFGAVSYATHSDIPVTEKIATLQGLVDRYNSLDEAGKAAVLQKLLDKRPVDGYARSQATTDALAEALTEVEAEQDAIAQALAAVNAYLTPESYNYSGAPEALEEHLATLGLDVGTESDYAALDKTATGGKNRKTAVFYDLNNNKPAEGYDLSTLTTYFNDMVATRLVTEESMDLVNNAENTEALNGISFVTMLLDRFGAVSYATHSDIPVTEKIATLQGLVDRYNSLDEAGKAAVLQKLLDKRPVDGYARSQATTDALAEALTEVEAEQDAIAQALAAVNAYLTPESYNYSGAPEALEEHLATLGLDVGTESDYAALDKTATGGKNRKTAVFYDLNNNKPAEGYDLSTLTTYFNDMVATRLVTEESMDLVNNAENTEALNGISFVTMLLDRFGAVSYATHSDIPVTEKIATLQGLVDRYNSLDEAGKAAVLQKLLDKRPVDGYARSQATTDALAEALTEVEAEQDAIAQALAAVNAYLTPESYNYSGAPEALEEHLATLGLDVGTESDYAALDKTATGGKNRKTAVFYDLNNNKPAEGYDLSTLTTYFNDMVATRLVTEESMDLVNNAENTEALNGISFVTMLLDRFGAVSYATHSDIPVTEKIATLQGLVDRYNSLDEAGKAAVLQKLLDKRPVDGYARSQATTDALAEALTEVEAEQDAIAQALAAVNAYLTPESYNYSGAPEALEEHLATLGLDVGTESDYAALDKTATGGKNRKTAVFYDLNNNKPAEGYDLSTLTTYFNDMVATRLVTEESMDLVNNAENTEALNGISFVTMLLDRFGAVSYATHSDIPVTEKIATLQGLVDRYNSLDEAGKAAVLQKLLDKRPVDGYARSQATTDALAEALTEVEAEQDAIAQALAAVNAYLTPESYNYSGAPEALEEHLATLGLDVGTESDYAALDKTATGGKNRKTAVFYDLNNNKPAEGYDLSTLTTYFNDMVATRLVTEESMDLVNNAENTEALNGISFVTMLLDRFGAVSYATHSDIPVTEKIATLQGLVDRYNSLDEAGKAAVLQKLLDKRPVDGYARSQATTDALAEALTEVEAEQDAIAQALAAVNAYLTPESYNYSGAPEALEEHLATLGLDVGTESDYAALDKTATGGKNRKTAVFYDLNNNKPAEGYDLSTLTTYFNDMVATRLVTEESMDLVNNAENTEALNGISFVTMLLDRFGAVSYATHSDIPVTEKIATLQGLVDRYNSLDEAGKAAVLQKLLDKRPVDGYARSQATTDALAEALTEVEAEQDAIAQALAAVNAYLTPESYNYSGAPEALEEHLATLGLDVGTESDYAALDKTATGGKNRKTAVFYDLNNNKPAEGYDLSTLTTYFNDMVATRLVTEESMDLVNNAENTEALNGISFVTMLLDRFGAVSYATHSDIPVTEKIATLQGLVDRYNSLDEAGKAAVLQKLLDKRPVDGYARSQATTDALAEALTEVEAEQDAIAQALAAVNAYLTPESYNYSGAPEALEEHLATLGLDVGTESDYAALDKTATGGKNRKTAVFYDLNNNKPAEGYDLSTLTTYFNDMVATRLVTEESMDLVNNAENTEALNGISFVTMLLDRFGAVSYATHSDIPVTEKIATLQGLVDRYNSLDEAGKAAVLQKLLDKRPVDGYARSQATTDALAEALTEVEAEQDAIAQALAAVNAYLTPESYNYSGAPEALEEHLATLGLDVGTESDYAALDKTATGGKNRKTAVFYDLNNNKPAEGYDLSTLTTYFNDMVATRLVTEESMDLVNNAENTEALNGISFVTMLLDRFGAVSYATHSDIPVTEKIATLQGLVDRYNSLDEAGKAAVLQKLLDKRPVDGYARSQATTDALAEALTEVEAEQDAIAQALAAVNAYLTPESYNYSGAPEALEEHLATLGLDVGTESDYAALDKTATGGKNRKTAVFYDLNNNKPAEGYDLSTLTTYFNDMVATRLVTEESMDLVNNAENTEALNGISFVTMLLDRFGAVSYATHSDIPVTEKIATLQGLVDRYNSLDEAGKAAVLQKLLDKRPVDGYARSQATTDALAEALTEVEAEQDAIAQALAAVNAYLTPESYNYSGAPEALEEHLATLGLDVGTESDYAALDKTATGGKNRKTAVFYDLNNNKPAEGYDLSTLTTYFNDMVATRLVTEESMDLVNNAENTEALNGISFVTMLLDRFGAVSYATHSDIPVTEKIATLQGLVDRYNSLDEAGKAAVLQKLLDKRPVDGYARSQATTDALAEALTEVEAEQDAIAQALAAVNAYLTPESYNYSGAPEALEEHLATLGLDVGTESDYAALDKTATGGKNRKTAVFYDLNNNKPAEGYDLSTLTTYFNDMVATRLVTEESMDLVNNAENTEALNGISFVTMLLDRFGAVSYADPFRHTGYREDSYTSRLGR
jgi:NADH:ubiquinone oxidoreductase subunit D